MTVRLVLAGTCLLLLSPSPLPGQSSVVERPITLKDLSPKTSPISVTGQVVLRCDSSSTMPFSYGENVLAKNVSKKAVLFMAIHIEATGPGTPPGDFNYTEDYLFSEALQPGSVETRNFPAQSFGTSVNGNQQTCEKPDPKLTATETVEFVQFSDGSIWGDKDVAQFALDARSKAISELDWLEHIYEQRGNDSFLEELSRVDDYSYAIAINELKYRCKEKASDPEYCHNAIQRVLQTARGHEAAMSTSVSNDGEP
jgi:hypothetical protein